MMIPATESKAQWVSTTNFTTDIITCLTTNEVELFAGTSKGTIFSTADNGSTWTLRDSGLTCTSIFTVAFQGSVLFAGTDSGVCKSTNNGNLWSKSSEGLSQSSIHAIAVNDTFIFAATDHGIFRSSDSGRYWHEADSGLTSTRVSSLAISDTNLIAGTAGGGVFISKDNGRYWSGVYSRPGSFSVGKLLVNNAMVYASFGYAPPYVAYYAGVCVSNDYGNSWKLGYSYGSIEGAGMIVYDFASSGTQLFEAASFQAFGNPSINGVFLSRDSAMSWSNVSTGLQDSNVCSLAISGSWLFAGTYQAGVWKRSLSEMIASISDHNTLPEKFLLLQNYPNPFNPTTTIRYQLPAASNVSLKVYDILGREVAFLVNEKQNAGAHQVSFNANKLSSGAYFYKIQAGTYISVKKMVLLK
ncbi:MAG TPA: T9SS type A sorting domain-containing protein [Bacteroidota bacterium]|nr:T9SS type A sorting domain-containing protein [Bacteroidota bacterium]